MAKTPAWAVSKGEPIAEQFVQQLDREAKEARLYACGVETLPPPALAIRHLGDEERARRRLSPRRNRWADVAAFDQRVLALERKQTAIHDELQALVERHRQAEQHDRDALAAWVDRQDGDRPEPTAPDVQRRIEERRADWDALTIAVSSVLAEKADYVEKHRNGSRRTPRRRGSAPSTSCARPCGYSRSAASGPPTPSLPSAGPAGSRARERTPRTFRCNGSRADA